MIQGSVGKSVCMMTLDSAADKTVVRADLVNESDYTGSTSTVCDYYGSWREIPLARVWLGIDDTYLFKHTVWWYLVIAPTKFCWEMTWNVLMTCMPELRLKPRMYPQYRQ